MTPFGYTVAFNANDGYYVLYGDYNADVTTWEVRGLFETESEAWDYIDSQEGEKS